MSTYSEYAALFPRQDATKRDLALYISSKIVDTKTVVFSKLFENMHYTTIESETSSRQDFIDTRNPDVTVVFSIPTVLGKEQSPSLIFLTREKKDVYAFTVTADGYSISTNGNSPFYTRSLKISDNFSSRFLGVDVASSLLVERTAVIDLIHKYPMNLPGDWFSEFSF